jgi:RNA polymerase sigma-70 factor (ECF subfamily)
MRAIHDLADLAQRFDADRRHLRSVAFQLLGSVADADDAVQSAWLKASRSDSETPNNINKVENLTGWFTTITAHEALDQLRVRKRRAERPLVDPDELDRLAGTASAPADQDGLLADSVSSALLVVLDRLSPAQRVAFVLHDVFAVPFEAIAGLLDRSPAVAKKLASRARGRLHADPAAQPGRVAEHVEIVEAFLTASRGGDIATLLNLLAPVVRFTLRARVGAVILIDGVPGIVIAPVGRAQALLQIGVGEDNRIHTIDITGDTARVRRAVLTLPRWPSQNCHKPIGYQGHRTKPATRQGEDDAR